MLLLASNWTAVRTAIKACAEDMTIANGYNYDWAVYNRDDLSRGGDCFMSLLMPKNTQVEDLDRKDSSDRGQGTQLFENFRYFTMKIRVKRQAVETGETDPTLDEAWENAEINLEKAKDDIMKKFSYPSDVLYAKNNNVCVPEFNIGTLNVIETETSPELEPFVYECDCSVRYTQNRSL